MRQFYPTIQTSTKRGGGCEKWVYGEHLITHTFLRALELTRWSKAIDSQVFRGTAGVQNVCNLHRLTARGGNQKPGCSEEGQAGVFGEKVREGRRESGEGKRCRYNGADASQGIDEGKIQFQMPDGDASAQAARKQTLGLIMCAFHNGTGIQVDTLCVLNGYHNLPPINEVEGRACKSYFCTFLKDICMLLSYQLLLSFQPYYICVKILQRQSVRELFS